MVRSHGSSNYRTSRAQAQIKKSQDSQLSNEQQGKIKNRLSRSFVEDLKFIDPLIIPDEDAKLSEISQSVAMLKRESKSAINGLIALKNQFHDGSAPPFAQVTARLAYAGSISHRLQQLYNKVTSFELQLGELRDSVLRPLNSARFHIEVMQHEISNLSSSSKDPLENLHLSSLDEFKQKAAELANNPPENKVMLHAQALVPYYNELLKGIPFTDESLVWQRLALELYQRTQLVMKRQALESRKNRLARSIDTKRRRISSHKAKALSIKDTIYQTLRQIDKDLAG